MPLFNQSRAFVAGAILAVLAIAPAQPPKSRQVAEVFHQPPYLLRRVPDQNQLRPLVYLNGILQEPGTSYVMQKNIVTFTGQPVATTDNVTVVYWAQ